MKTLHHDVDVVLILKNVKQSDNVRVLAHLEDFDLTPLQLNVRTKVVMSLFTKQHITPPPPIRSCTTTDCTLCIAVILPSVQSTFCASNCEKKCKHWSFTCSSADRTTCCRALPDNSTSTDPNSTARDATDSTLRTFEVRRGPTHRKTSNHTKCT